MSKNIMQKDIDKYFNILKKDGEAYGYHLNPDESFTKELVKGLMVNGERYGYAACPCRLATGKIENDRDIVCPCDYRDTDLNDYGSCYCGLYVSGEILKGEKKPVSIPERRYTNMESEKKTGTGDPASSSTDSVTIVKPSQFKDIFSLPIWRCKVCGYLCGREQPPEVCPICKAKKDRFEKFF